MAFPLPFGYDYAAAGVSGAIADINTAKVDTIVLTDSNGTYSGRLMLEMTVAFPQNGRRIGQRVRTAGVRRFAGIVVYDAGKPGDPDLPEYQNGEPVPVCRSGRQWVYCENFAVAALSVDPALFFARDTGALAGQLRYGDDDGATCTVIPSTTIRVLDSRSLAGGAALLLVEHDFRIAG